MIKTSNNRANEQSAAEWYASLQSDEQERARRYYPNDLLSELNSSSPPTLEEVLTGILRTAKDQRNHDDVIAYAKQGMSLKTTDITRVLFYDYLIKAFVNVAIKVCHWDEVAKYCLQALAEYSRSKYPQQVKKMDTVYDLRGLCKRELIHVAKNRKNFEKEEQNLQFLVSEGLLSSEEKNDILQGIRDQLNHRKPTYLGPEA